MNENILIVEDDPEVGEYLETALKTQGYHVMRTTHADRAVALVRERHPDLLLLDLVLPGLSGWDLLRALRRDPGDKRLPIIAMSARQKSAFDASEVLYEGADDFILKPVEPDVLVARVEAHLRRRGWDDASAPKRDWAATADGKVRLHLASRMLELKSRQKTHKRYDLTPKEFDLLALLLRREGEVLSRDLIRDSLWPENKDVYARTVDKLIELLRKKLAPHGDRIETVSGVGYVLRPA